ncbi:YdeI/OmpD-associated family protein [Dyadobacter sp. CY107]|uniref:YdeI/OmpD-associated family protein n=1 Tax=Dyadobacter fanqingshengii TaxID=2906443 RepID=UPI001F1C2DC8|nr:YdeI/OmpD-associated family protein [Dyadobacter fanqingshengii]MCF2505224.1 YdeI/OmpD-associated family protein [Dyadobacter fanqingshengii]
MELKDGVHTFYAKSQEDWRKWLEENHQSEKSVWLIIYKKDSGTPSVNYTNAVDEALCFGWIDSKPNKRDEGSYYQFFAKRNPKSNWSKVNKGKVERLLELGLMTQAGLEAIEIAKERGTWTALDDVDEMIIPEDLQMALDKNKTALAYFDNFPRSSKRGILEWIMNAKRPETRQKRIDETVELATKNVKANHFRQ